MARRWIQRSAIALLGLALLLFLAVVVTFGPVAVGHASLVTAIGHFASQDSLENVREDRLRYPFGLDRLVFVWVDEEADAAHASFAGLVHETTVWHPGAGARRGERAVPKNRLMQSGLFEVAELTTNSRFSPITSGEFWKGTHSIAVWHAGSVVHERYRGSYGPFTPLLSWSISKSVTATLVGRLVELGAITDIDDRAPVPEWDGDPLRSRITWRDLLQMQSGLEFESDYETPWSDSLQMLFVEQDAGAYAASKPALHEPGTVWEYSDGTSNILARLVCDVIRGLDRKPREFLKSELFQRIGMRNATFTADDSGNFVGSSLCVASTRDWLNFGRLSLGDGVFDGKRLLPEGWVDFVTSPGLNPRYGAHFWRYDVPEDDPLHGVFYASGFGGQVVVIDRERNLVFCRFGVHPKGGRFDHMAFSRAVVGAVDAL